MADTELLAIADELYALPLTSFTPIRDGLAKEHKGTELGARLKKLKKPTVAAWVVNLLVRREPGQVDQLLNVGAALREAQLAMSAAELRTLTKQRRQVTAAVVQQARRHAAAEGVKITQSVADQVEATLTAALVDAQAGRAVRSGLIVTTLQTTGVEAIDESALLASVAAPEALGFAATARDPAASEPPALRVVPDPDAGTKQLAAAEERLEQAAAAHETAAAAHADAVDDVERLEARSLQLQAEADELRRRLAAIDDDIEEVDDELSDAQEVRAEASASLRTATAERDAAATEVSRLS